MDTSLIDLRIVGLDADKTQPSHRASGLRHIYLRLSSHPPAVWAKCFAQSREFPRHSMWRKCWIEGSHIVVDCVPEEIERYHLQDLKQDVEVANRDYRQWLAQREAAERRKQEAATAEQARIAGMAARLKFD